MISAYNLGDATGTGAAAGLRCTLVRDYAGRITGYTHTSNGAPATSLGDPQGTSSISHDAAGHMTVHGGQTLAYSDRGRLASVSSSGGTTSYLYNGLEQCVRKSGSLVPTGQSHYVYDEAGRLLGEYDAHGELEHSRVANAGVRAAAWASGRRQGRSYTPSRRRPTGAGEGAFYDVPTHHRRP